jgi:hypothetical protein
VTARPEHNPVIALLFAQYKAFLRFVTGGQIFTSGALVVRERMVFDGDYTRSDKPR